MSTFGGMQGNGSGSGWLSSLTSMVGGIFLTSDETQPVVRGQRISGGEEGMLLALYEAAHLNRNFMTTLAHSSSAAALPMRHRKIVLEEPTSQPLASTLIVEFIMCHLLKKFPGELYQLCIGVLLRLLSYQKRCRVRLTRDWRPLWAALIALLKF
ncbi:Uncharacterized protein OBRU01_25586, partial [Operophtera brumata]